METERPVARPKTGEVPLQRTTAGPPIVLLVNDHPDWLTAMSDLAIEMGFRVLRSGNGRQAIELFESYRPIVTVVDLFMPVVDGFGVLEHIAECYPRGDYPVVVTSGVYETESCRQRVEKILQPSALLDGSLAVSDLLLELITELSIFKPEVTRAEPDLILNDFRAPASRGNLDSIRVIDLFVYAMLHDFSGYLGLSDGQVKKVIFWRSGQPIYCRCTDYKESFGHYLIKKGLITEEQEKQSRLRMKQTGRFQSEALVGLQILDPGVIFQHLNIHLNEMVTDSFGWVVGQFMLSDDERVLSKVLPMEINALDVLFKGVATYYDSADIEAQIDVGPEDTLEFLDNAPALRWEHLLATREVIAVKAARQGRSLSDIATASRLEYKQVLVFFYTLYKLGIIGFRAGKKRAASLAVDRLIGPDPELKSVAEVERMERFMRYHIQHEGKTFFEVYDMEPGGAIDVDALRHNYFKLSKRFHPDKFRKYADWNLERVIDQLAQLINKGYETLRDANRRQEYVDKLNGLSEADRRRSNRDSEARALGLQHFETGIQQLDQGEIFLATENFRRSLELVPSEGRYAAWFHFARFVESPGKGRRKAYEQLQKLTDDQGAAADVLYLLGVLDLHAGAFKLAGRRFQGALEHATDHILANEANEMLQDALRSGAGDQIVARVEAYLTRFRKPSERPKPTVAPAPQPSQTDFAEHDSRTPIDSPTLDSDDALEYLAAAAAEKPSFDAIAGEQSGTAYPMSPSHNPPPIVTGAENALYDLDAIIAETSTPHMPGFPENTTAPKPGPSPGETGTTAKEPEKNPGKTGDKTAKKGYDIDEIFKEIDL